MTKLVTNLIRTGFLSRPPKQWPAYDGTMLDRRLYVSASEISYCARRIVYDKMLRSEDANSPTVGDESYGFAQRGHTAEAWIVDNLMNVHGLAYEFMFVGAAQVSFYHGKQSGTPDGLMKVLDPTEHRLLEFKCIDPRTVRKNLPKGAHVDQCIQNMDLIRRCLGVKVELAHLTYIDASNYEDVNEFIVPYDEAQAKRLTARAEQIMSYTSPEEAPPEGVYTGDCKYCNFKSLCSGAVTASKRETEKRKEMTNVASRHFR